MGHEQYAGRLVIPYVTPTGVVDLRFRSITDDSGPKYLSRPGSDQTIYGVEAFQVSTDTIAVCEGEFDSIIAWNECGIPAVGIPGAGGWHGHYWRAFEDYDKVIVFLDGDQAGRDFGKKVAASLEQAVLVSMPDGEDVNSVFISEGAEGIRRRAGL